jgi:folate-binding protein YgfZ
MDDVELHSLDEATTGIALLGPKVAQILETLGLQPGRLDSIQFAETNLAGIPATLVHAYSLLGPRYELWFHPQHTAEIWKIVSAAGAQHAGIAAVEALRVLSGIPAYGIDITDRHLAQETSQTRALNFTKGCYLGQEIVERIRSRATIHRNLRQFRLVGETPAPPLDLRATGDPAVIGQLTSIAEIRLPHLQTTVALGFLRNEALERKLGIEYDGGIAAVFDPGSVETVARSLKITELLRP